MINPEDTHLRDSARWFIPHVWDDSLVCVHCWITTELALKRNPDTKGAGPCYGHAGHEDEL